MKANIAELQSLVKEGHFGEASKRLRGLKKIGRAQAATLANIAWRINQPSLTVKILNPIVRHKNHIKELPTAIEKIEYAEGLRRLGAVDEAWQLLNEVDGVEYPQATLYKIFCLFNQWRYEEALPLLRQYLASDKLEDYARAVGKINLAAALIQVGSLQEAQELLYLIRDETKKAKLNLLHGNSLELSAQLSILQTKYDEALAYLGEASKLLSDAGSVFALFVEKWTAIAESLKQNRVTPELHQVFLKAMSVKHWETVRDCDLYISSLEKNHARLERLFCGTPYESFRRRILLFAGGSFQPQPQYLWSLTADPKTTFDLSTALVEGQKKGSLPIGQALHRFMILLTRDLYRPLPALSAFSRLFPDEHLNSETSANRVHQIVKRCRKWIAEVGISLHIEEVEGAYKLIVGPDLGLILPTELLPLESKELEWLQLARRVGVKAFDIRDAMYILSSSPSNTLRLLRWALDKGLIQKIGKGSRTSYQVIS